MKAVSTVAVSLKRTITPWSHFFFSASVTRPSTGCEDRVPSEIEIARYTCSLEQKYGPQLLLPREGGDDQRGHFLVILLGDWIGS